MPLAVRAQFPDGSFEAIVDKGGLDALMGEDAPGSEEAGGKLLAEVARLLAPAAGSCYLCVTLAQPHVLRARFPMRLPPLQPTLNLDVGFRPAQAAPVDCRPSVRNLQNFCTCSYLHGGLGDA